MINLGRYPGIDLSEANASPTPLIIEDNWLEKSSKLGLPAKRYRFGLCFDWINFSVITSNVLPDDKKSLIILSKVIYWLLW